MIRHFTSTVFVVHDNKIALHWHDKVKMWLPPGGHVDINEDPVQAAIRECKEEMGIEIFIYSESKFNFQEKALSSIFPPETILLETVEDIIIGTHEHIDFIYFGYPKISNFNLSPKWIWVDSYTLLNKIQLQNPLGDYFTPPNDVIVLGLEAISKLKNLSTK